MNVWIILVTYYKHCNISNVSQKGYATYEEAKREVLNKIKPVELRVINDYEFYDCESDIQYEIKSVFIDTYL